MFLEETMTEVNGAQQFYMKTGDNSLGLSLFFLVFKMCSETETLSRLSKLNSISLTYCQKHSREGEVPLIQKGG